MGSLHRSPDEINTSKVSEEFPCRERQIRSLLNLLHPEAAPCRNLVIHGTPSTGKSAVTTRLLSDLTVEASSEKVDDEEGRGSLSFAVIDATKCITARHLFETITATVAEKTLWQGPMTRCETLAQLTVELGRMLEAYMRDQSRLRFVLVLDAIDKQRDAPSTLVPALARLSEIISCLTTVFIVTSPPAALLRSSPSPHVHFPPYAKTEYVQILSLTPPTPIPSHTQQETTDLFTRFCAAVHDSLTKSASRTLPTFRHSCLALWPRFIAPIQAGTHTAKEFSKLLIAARAHFQDETLLNPSIVSATRKPTTTTSGVKKKNMEDGATGGSSSLSKTTDLATLLPTTARLLLLAAYLASHNATKHDLTLFSTYHHGRKRRRGGGGFTGRGANPKHRKIARKLLGAHAFVLERMMAIFAAVRSEWADGSGVGAAGLDADVGVAIATLASLRLLVKVGAGGDVMDRGGKWRINVGWEVIRGIGRSIGVEVEEWLVD